MTDSIDVSHFFFLSDTVDIYIFVLSLPVDVLTFIYFIEQKKVQNVIHTLLTTCSGMIFYSIHVKGWASE